MDDIDRYVQLAKIAHKYDMQSLEAWATSGLASLAKTEMSIPDTQAALLLDVFYLCGCTDVGDLILQTFKDKLNAGTCSTKTIASVINIGQKYGLPGLISRGYYAMMLKPKSDWETEHTLSWRDRHRLLNGHYTLSKYSLHDSINSLEAKFSAYFAPWSFAWEKYATQSQEARTRKLHNLQLVDIVERLRQLVESFLRDTPTVKTTVVNMHDMHITIFRHYLECVIDDLFETKLFMCFVDPAEQTADSK